MSKKVVRKGYHRSAYTRSDGTKVAATYVPPTLITDRGAPGKGPKLIDLTDYRHLSDFGYSFSKSRDDRAKALRKAINANGATWTIRRLNAIRNVSHRTNPSLSKKAEHDIKYVQGHLD